MSKVARSSSAWVGKATHWPLISATRTPPIGPENGSPASWVDSDAALMATTSYRCCGSSAMIVATIWISLRRPLTKDGRSGRSMSRQVRIASSHGRPSRRKNEPGIRPAAYIRSSTSTVSGKKSRLSFGCLDAVVADRIIVSSSRSPGGTGGLLGEPARLEPDRARAELAVIDDGLGTSDTLHG